MKLLLLLLLIMTSKVFTKHDFYDPIYYQQDIKLAQNYYIPVRDNRREIIINKISLDNQITELNMLKTQVEQLATFNKNMNKRFETMEELNKKCNNNELYKNSTQVLNTYKL